uniref:RING-type domain-containing protein n=1 Tax=Setaria italica TaxID=4555 RepID=K3ZF56_SETIT
MDARMHYSRPLLLQLQQGPAVSPAPAPATTAGAVPDALSVPAPADAFTFLNANAILILALLVCGLVVALALHVVLTCALRVTRRACRHSGAADGDAPQQGPGNGTGGGGGAGQQAAAARHGGKPRRLTKLVQALPCLAYSSGLELAGSSRSECAICLAAFARGEAVRVLPRCNHGFHARCIDRWLASRPTCPTCRQAPFAQTTALLQPDGSGQAPAAVPLVRVVIKIQ